MGFKREHLMISKKRNENTIIGLNLIHQVRKFEQSKKILKYCYRIKRKINWRILLLKGNKINDFD